MATITPPSHNPPSSSSSSISRLLSRLRSKSRRQSQFIPERSQPIDTRPPLKPSPLPLVLPEHQHTLSQLGWTTVTLPTSFPSQVPPSSSYAPPPPAHPLTQASSDLFAASQAFFALPDSEKERWKHKLGSEEGWSKIPGEKEFITLRTLSYTPDVLKGPAKRYWDLVGNYLDSCLERIGTSLDLPTSTQSADEMDGDMDGEGGGADSSQRPSSININSNPEPGAESGLRRYIGPCKSLHHAESKKTATMLRLFRYESWSPKIVAEPHADLGLLSLVIGDVPGLEVWNGHQFWDIEREYHRWGPEKPCATLLGGRQLERLSNFRYAAGGHRVVSYGKPAPIPPPALSKSTKKGHSHDNTDTTVLDGEGGDKAYRYSIVFVLRAHEDVIVDTDALTTSITGVFKEPVRGLRAGTWYEQIRGKHFNINIGFEEREKQRRKVAGRKAGVGIGMQGQEKGKEEGRDGGMGAG